jgi:hypothetical protein
MFYQFLLGGDVDDHLGEVAPRDGADDPGGKFGLHDR